MENLPDDILLEILSYFSIKCLSNHARVCKKWYNLITSSARLNRQFIMDRMQDLVFLKEWPSSRYIKYLNIRMEVDLINSLFLELEDLCPYLTSLTINKCNVLSERHVYRLSKCFPRLIHIDIFLTSNFISQHFLDILKPMRSIVLNNQIDETTLRMIASNCPNLNELLMYGYVQFYPLSQLKNLLTLRHKQLKKLTLRCYELNDKTCQIISHCLNLQHLCLYHCWFITDAGLLYLPFLKFLKTLHLTGLKLVTRGGFVKFLQSLNMKYLTELNFSSSVFNDHHALVLSEKISNLSILELWNCKELSSTGINHIINSSKKLYIIDLNMELSEEVLSRIVFESDIRFLTYDNTLKPAINIPKDRNLEIRSAFRCYNELYFRGNSEGFRANVLCYSYQHNFPYLVTS